MAKYNEREGNSCHIHLSLRDLDGEPVFAGDGHENQHSDRHGFSPVFEQFLAGQLYALRELTLVLRAEHQQLQALRRRQFRADRDRLGS